MSFDSVEVLDTKGVPVVIRLAIPEDIDAVKSSIADHSGTGSGTGSDDYLIQEFTKRVSDPGYTWLFVTTADEKKEGLGMIAVAWSSPTASYWQSLRIASHARGRGLAKILFHMAAKLCVQKQGSESVSRWGIVSNNSIMAEWSTRLKLHGPLHFRRHGAEPDAQPPTLPEGYMVRSASQSDIPAILAAVKTFPIWQSEYSSQNFMRIGWSEFNEAELSALIAQEANDSGLPPPAPRILVDASGAIVAFCSLGKIQFGPVLWLMHKYSDGNPDALKLLLAYLPHVAHLEGCKGVGGYVPSTPWLLEYYAKETCAYKRATATEQLEFHWRNVDYDRA